MWRDPTDDDSDRLEPCGELSPPLEREAGSGTIGPLRQEGLRWESFKKGVTKPRIFKRGLY